MNDTYGNAATNSAMYYNATTSTATTSRTNPTNQGNAQGNAPPGQQNLTSHTINDIYSQISQLHNQLNTYQNTTNEKFNQFNLKLNYIHESMEATKRNVNELSQQVIYISQNNSTMGFTNHFKTIELFGKHINELSKDLEELSNSAGLHKSLHPQLQSQHHLNIPNPSPSNSGSGTATTSHTVTNSGHFEDEPQLGKTLGIRSPNNSSNPTSPFIPQRFNFDLNPFSSGRNGNAPQQAQQNFHEPVQTKSKKRRKEMENTKRSPPQPVHHHQNPTQQQHQQQQAANMNNYNMLPLPNLLGNTPSNKPVNVQYMSTIPPSELRHPDQARASFFGDDDIEHGIDDLGASDNNGTGNGKTTGAPPVTSGTSGATAGSSSSDGTTATSANSAASGETSQSDIISTSPIDEKPKKRKLEDNSSNSISLSTSSDIPKYKLERSLKSIGDIWKEYEYGLNDKPPLKLLEIKYGTKWRNDTESRTFLRRKKIYEAIENGKNKGYTEDQIIQELEDYRSYEHNGSIRKKPLSWLNANMPEKYES